MLALLDQGHRFRRGRTRVVVVLPVFGAPWLLAVAMGWGSGMAWDQGMAWGFAWWWPGPAPTSPGNAAICPSRPPSACAHGWTRRALNLGGPGGQAIRGLLPPGTGTAAAAECHPRLGHGCQGGPGCCIGGLRIPGAAAVGLGAGAAAAAAGHGLPSAGAGAVVPLRRRGQLNLGKCGLPDPRVHLQTAGAPIPGSNIISLGPWGGLFWPGPCRRATCVVVSPAGAGAPRV